MRRLRTGWLFRILLAFVAITLLGAAALIWARLPVAALAPPALPQRLEWRSDPQSGAVSLLLHGTVDHPGYGALVPVLATESTLPGLPEVWRELLAARPRQTIALPEQRDGFDGLQLFGVDRRPASVPFAPQPLPGFPMNAAVRDRQIWLACARSGLSVLILDDPLQPELRKAWEAPWASYVAFAGNLAFLLDSAGRLEVVELGRSGEARLVVRQSLHQANVEYAGMTVYRGRLLLLKYDNESRQLMLNSRDFAPGGRPSSNFSEASLPTRARSGCWLRDGRLYLNDSAGRLFGIDVGNPLRPQVFLDVVLPAQVARMAWSGRLGLAQLVDGRIYAVPDEPATNRESPVRYLGQEQKGFPVLLAFALGRLYAFSQERGVEVFPALPVPSEPPMTVSSAPARLSMELWSPDILQVVNLPTGLAVLEAGGRVRLVHTVDGRWSTVATVETGDKSRWLAAYGDRLYVGGGTTINVLTINEQGKLLRSGDAAFPGEASFDGVVIDGTLCVAAGRQGLTAFSLADPDRPVIRPPGRISPLPMQRLDVKALAVRDGQLFAAGGPAGLLVLAVDREKGVKLVGVRPFAAPVAAAAAVGNLLLVATPAGIELLAMSESARVEELQALASLPVKNGQRLMTVGNDRIGVRAAEGAWQTLPLPVLLPGRAGNPSRFLLPATVVPGEYRLVLFNRDGVAEWPARLAVPARDQNGPGRG